MYNNAHRGCANEDVIGDAICRQLPENADEENDAVCRLRRATFERRKVSATHEHVGARASPSYARERNASTRRLSARGEEASATHAPVNRMRWPTVGPRSATSGCVRARTRAHATRVRNDNVGLRTFIIIYWVGWTHPHPLRYCLVHASIYMYFCIIAFNLHRSILPLKVRQHTTYFNNSKSKSPCPTLIAETQLFIIN